MPASLITRPANSSETLALKRMLEATAGRLSKLIMVIASTVVLWVAALLILALVWMVFAALLKFVSHSSMAYTMPIVWCIAISGLISVIYHYRWFNRQENPA